PESKMDLADAGKIAVQDSGRVKPLDSLAQTSLMVISSRSTFVDEKRKEHSALEWLFDVMAGEDPLDENNRASRYKVFRIENIQLLDFLQLPYRPGSWRYSIQEMAKKDKFASLEEEAERLRPVDDKKLDLFETKLLELRKHLDLYYSFASLRAPGIVPGEDASARWKSLGEAEQKIRQAALLRLQEAAV